MVRTIFSTLAISSIICFVGCGSNHPTVSGKVTVNGQPLQGVRVLFYPNSTADNPFPGPFAEGVTDASGVYTLVTRDGSRGGTLGANTVELYPSETIELDFMKSELDILYAQSNNDEKHPAYRKAKELEKKMESVKSLSSGDKLTPVVKTEFSVPENGTDSANFELMDFAPAE